MLPRFLLLTLRNLRRRPFFSVVNISGLAVGLAACWLIGLFVRQQVTYDHFLPDYDRICQVNLDLKFGGSEGVTSNTPPPVGATLTAELPEIEAATRVFDPGDVVVRSAAPGYAPLFFNETGVSAVDTNFLEVFGFPLIAGDPQTCLDQPGSVVLTERLAQKYFGSTSPIGQTLYFGTVAGQVTGVLQDLPANSSLRFDALVPMADYPVVKRFNWSWVWLQVDTWVRLREKITPVSLAQLEAKLPAVVRKHAAAAFERIGQPLDLLLQKGGRWDFHLLPLAAVHLHSAGVSSRLQTLGDLKQVRVFGLVGLFVLLLACVNFMNLSTARSLQRAKEVGVRKALGSGRRALAGQFLGESLLYCAIAAVLALLLTLFALPFFNQLTGDKLHFTDLFSGSMLLITAGLPVLAGLIGGLYPAFYLSGFKAAHIFKSAFPIVKGGHATVRSGLVVFQFTVSIALILGTFIVFEQLQFLRNQPLGIQRENVLVVSDVQRLGSEPAQETFRQQLLQLPEVMSASQTTDLPAGKSFGDMYVPEQGTEARPVSKDISLSSFLTDYDFVPTLGITMQEGRNFSRDFPSDSTGVILNEAAVKMIGWQQPIGQWMRYPGGNDVRYQVIGVMRDFHTESLHTPIGPFALFHQSSHTYQLPVAYLAVRIRPGTERTLLPKISAIWTAASPDMPFDYSFLDTNFAQLYQTEQKTGAVLGIFTLLALFIGCLGLFALAAFTAEQRIKEIGIRKVLGASVFGITGMLTGNFLRLVLLALVIASPLAYWAMDNWLADFAYRIHMSWGIFALAGLVALIIAFLTVGFQSIKAALANPVKSLRNE